MPKKKPKKGSKAPVARTERQLAAAARRREAQAKLAEERAADPTFVPRTAPKAPTSRWPADAEAAAAISAKVAEQSAAFRAKFGRDPGPDDPLFFNPDADYPVPISVDDAETTDDAWMQTATVAAANGMDPAIFLAARDVGYIVTDDNRHEYSFMQVDAYRKAVAKYHREGAGDL
jgi:hypothetical protein